MNTPTVYTPRQIKTRTNDVTAGLPDGRWVEARPMGWHGLCIRKRLRCAWNVFTGKWDCLRWEGQE